MNSKFMQIKIDSARILHETVSNETLIIDSETGIYHILRGSGAEIWQMIIQGLDLSSLIDQIAQQSTTPKTEIELAVQKFVNELQQAGLVSLSAAEAPSGQPSAAVAGAPQGQTAAAFVPPELHTFNDMNDLLLIDPIHEVAETGWPFTAKQKS